MKKPLYSAVIILISALIVMGGERDSHAAISINFVNEQRVNIIGYTGDAMEPFISRDGNYLFWNSLNDSVNTSIFYARKINNSNFKLIGKVEGVNGNPPHLDAVPSMDILGRFYWVSTRNYPNVVENYQSGYFDNGIVKGVAPVKGDFYIKQPGWIVMDAEISPDGKLLFYVNAKFTGGAIPIESDIGVAHNVNGEFIKDPNSALLFLNINTKDFLEYAPSFQANGLEIFFTRIMGNKTYIFAAKRTSLVVPFGTPELINIKGNLPEAPSLSGDGKMLYYHKKDGKYFSIFMMSRNPQNAAEARWKKAISSYQVPTEWKNGK